MCGIAGYKTTKNIDSDVLKKMVRSLYHRGPDSEGYYYTNTYCAGMRRLSINGLLTGDQPLYNENKSIVLFYNGEIYNYQELKTLLEKQNYTFKTGSDGEVICHLYDEYKEKLFEHLDGMFAIALWVEKEQKLILARDIPGEKPLYYIKLAENEIVYSSEIKSLVYFPKWKKNFDIKAMWDFPTFLWVPEPSTIYKSVKALPRGNLLIADAKGIHIRPYTNKFYKTYSHDDHALSDDEAVEETRRIVTESVESRLLSDVPIGCFLSGGIDSSIVTTIASQYQSTLDTFTIGFENLTDPYHGHADESQYAEQFAHMLGTNHHTIRVTAKDFRENLDKFCYHGDQPFSVSSGLGILSIAKAARENNIKVLLSGDCADECFGGYSWYYYLNKKFHDHHNTVSNNSDIISFQNFGLSEVDRLSVLSKYAAQQKAWAWHYYAADEEKKKLFNPDFFYENISSLNYFYKFKDEAQWEPEDYIRQDRQFYLPNEMLRKLDRMTMAFSVEGRVPFAAPSVLAHADRLAFSQMVQNSSLKWVLRKAFSSVLPKFIYKRPKHGFNVPIDHWLKNEWKDLFEDTFSSDSALMNQGIIHKKSFQIAKQMLYDPKRLNGHTLFSFIMLNMWLENYYGNYC